MATDWDEISQLLRDAGQEAHLARRMTEERNKRNWSQGELARQLEKIGFRGLGQPAISAIEKPRARTGRRAITVDEAIALSRVFDIPLAELLLPEGALADVETHRSLRYGPEMRTDAYHRLGQYQHFVRALAANIRGSSAWKSYIDTALEESRSELGQRTEKPGERGASRRYEAMKQLKQKIAFLEDVLTELDGE